MLKDGDPRIVNQIAKVRVKSKGKSKFINFYSFATKYCSHHQPDKYVLYDYYVLKVLNYFKRKDKFSKYKKSDLLDYKKFHLVMLDFQKFYNLQSYSLKEIDKYLWQAGKEYFPRKY